MAERFTQGGSRTQPGGSVNERRRQQARRALSTARFAKTKAQRALNECPNGAADELLEQAIALLGRAELELEEELDG